MKWGIEPILEQLRVAPSTYYAAKARPPSSRELRDREIGPQLEDLWKKNYSVYGRRKLHRAATRKGLDVGRDQVARLMRLHEIRGASRTKKRFTTYSDPSAPRAADLVQREFRASRPNELWVADFTYCSTWSGVVYVAFITDVFSRRIVGWKASRSMTKELVIDALNMAAWTRRHLSFEQLTRHTDAGAHYVSIAYTDRLGELGVTAPIGTVGDSFDNTIAEPMFALFKTELFRNPAVLKEIGGHWKGLDDLEIETAKWASWFKEERLHSELGDLSPAEVEANYDDHVQVRAA